MFLSKEEGARRFAEAHQRYCELLVEEAQDKLARTLTEAEQQAIRDIKSFLYLEVLERELCAAQSAEEVALWLEHLIQASRAWVARERAFLEKQKLRSEGLSE